MIELAVSLVLFTGPDNQVIGLNPESIVTTRRPRHGDHFAPGVHCLIHTSDGKVVAVIEECETVRKRLAE